MPLTDIYIVLRFWGALFLVGATAYPLTRHLFQHWYDRGYMFSKAVGLALSTWVVYVLGMAKVAPFDMRSIVGAVGVVFIVGLFFRTSSSLASKARMWKIIVGEEAFFLVALVCWSWVKAHEPSIRGLEKFMDYGFMQSILNSTYFPPSDMWYPPLFINYYYFGHLVTAFLTKLSGLELAYTFNLMLATIFALTITMSFSIGYQLIVSSVSVHNKKSLIALISGGITAFLVTLSGNMQTIYAFTKGYSGEDVKPFWELLWGRDEFLSQLSLGIERYWYANATRFIPFTIHEFPSYSFVVSDIHGHVLSIPFVLLALALLFEVFRTWKEQIIRYEIYIFYGFLVGVLLMTNALDGPIYFVLGMVILAMFVVGTRKRALWKAYRWVPLTVLGMTSVTSLPFLSHFKSFVNGLAINCPLPIFANTKIGPILFEGVEKCQRSPLWMVWLLWGFFVYCFGIFVISKWVKGKGIVDIWNTKFTHIEKILAILFFISILLLIFPEFLYFKDIYPQHFRSNTMFKLGYQAFIMLSIVSGYVISKFLFVRGFDHLHRPGVLLRRIFILFLIPQLFLVSIYPLFSVRSYFGRLMQYEGLYGFTWMMQQYPDDYVAALWLKQQFDSSASSSGILVEADGDSYTDYERFSVLTGKPTPIGWAVHEWLWRGSYDVVAPRREDVRTIYESDDVMLVKQMVQRYDVRYIIVGTLERQKFTNLREDIFMALGTEVFRSGDTVIYMVRN